MIRKLGTFVEFSVMREPVTADWTIIRDSKELNVHGAHLGPTAIRWRSGCCRKGRLPMDEIVTHRLPLTRFQEGVRCRGKAWRFRIADRGACSPSSLMNASLILSRHGAR